MPMPASLLALLALVAGPVAAATITVDTLFDVSAVDGHCSLREAIQAANADAPNHECPGGSGDDVIDFAVTGSIVVADDLPVISDDLALIGPETGYLAITGSGTFALLDASPYPEPNMRLEVRGIILEGGVAGSGGCISGNEVELILVDSVLDDCVGSAIHLHSSPGTTILRTSIYDSTTDLFGGALAQLFPTGPTVIEESTFTRNSGGSDGSGGAGAIYLVEGEMEIRRSTISGNWAADDAGGIAAVGVSQLTLISTTVTDNLADEDADGVGDGGGILLGSATSDLVLRNSIVGENDDDSPGGPNDSNIDRHASSTITSLGYNLIASNLNVAAEFPVGLPNVNADWVGTDALVLDTGLDNLSSLNGGPTNSHLPDATSPAVDHGSCSDERWDQRGFGDPAAVRRLVDDPAVANVADGCDIGAVERGGVEIPTDVFADGFEGGSTVSWSASVP